jgi:hypothetical protein
MRFTASEVGLELHHRVAALTGDALHRGYEQTLEAFSEVSPAKELDWLFVFVRSFAQVDLPEVSGKFRLLVLTAAYVFVRRHHFTPGLEVRRRRAFDGGRSALTLFVAHLFIESKAQKLHLHFLDLVHLFRRDGS